MLERETLYLRFEPLVNRLVRRYGVDALTREELEGELQRRFQELLAGYDPRCGIPLNPYLSRALTDSAERYVERHHVRRHAPPPANGSLPDAAGLAASHLQPMAALIARLPLQQQQILVWRFYEMRPPGAIAADLGVPPRVVEQLLRRALLALRRRLRSGGT
jgi:RNA polymerase sigma factor (sigma-70 family)